MRVRKKKMKPEFIDERGFITRVLDEKNVVIKSILYISRKKGVVGANHYHKKDSHYIYCLSGKIRYGEKEMEKKDAKLTFITLEPGDLILSKPMVAHVTEFLEDTMFLAFATEHRDQEDYEKDTVRIKLI